MKTRPDQTKTDADGKASIQWQCEQPFVVCALCPQWCSGSSRFSRPPSRHSSPHRFLAPNVVVYALTQVLMPVSRQSLFQPFGLRYARLAFAFAFTFAFGLQ